MDFSSNIRRYTFPIIVAIYGIVFFCWLSSDIEKQDLSYTNSTLLPLANQIERMKSDLGRLPTQKEFQDWVEAHHGNKRIDYHTTQPEFCSDWGTQGEAFIVGAWRGDWMHYYCSWNQHNFPE